MRSLQKGMVQAFADAGSRRTDSVAAVLAGPDQKKSSSENVGIAGFPRPLTGGGGAGGFAMEMFALTSCAIGALSRRTADALTEGRLSKEGLAELAAALAIIGLLVSALEIAAVLAGA